jgi:hypothetical protein
MVIAQNEGCLKRECLEAFNLIYSDTNETRENDVQSLPGRGIARYVPNPIRNEDSGEIRIPIDGYV